MAKTQNLRMVTLSKQWGQTDDEVLIFISPEKLELVHFVHFFNVSFTKNLANEADIASMSQLVKSLEERLVLFILIVGMVSLSLLSNLFGEECGKLASFSICDQE